MPQLLEPLLQVLSIIGVHRIIEVDHRDRNELRHHFFCSLVHTPTVSIQRCASRPDEDTYFSTSGFLSRRCGGSRLIVALLSSGDGDVDDGTVLSVIRDRSRSSRLGKISRTAKT